WPHGGDAWAARAFAAWQPSENVAVDDQRQRYQAVSGLEDSPLQAASRTPGLRSVSKSPELQRELVRTGHGKRLNQNCRFQFLLLFDDRVVGKAARTTRDPA